MIEKNFKAHPMMIVRLMKPYLFALILPLVRALIQYLKDGMIEGLLTLEIVAFAFIVTLAIMGWRVISISVKGRYVTVKKGVLIKTCAVIEFSRLSSITLKQNIFDFLFSSADCLINTEAGRSKNSDFVIKMHTKDVKRLLEIIYGNEERDVVRFSAWRIALLAATTSSAVTGLLIGVPIVNKISNLVGVALSDMLFDEINNLSMRFNTVFPPIVNAVTLVLILAYGVSFVTSFVKNINFKLKNSSDVIEVQSGLILQKNTLFQKSKVNNICFEQTPLMRMIKKHCMKASVAGYGNKAGKNAVVVPVASHKELEQYLETLFPNFKKHKETIKPLKTTDSLNRFIYIPVVIATLIIVVSLLAVIVFPYFDRLILFLFMITMAVDGYYGCVCYHNYRFGKLYIEDGVFASGSLGFVVREIFCDKRKIGVIKISQTPADVKSNTCKVKITICSETADGVRVKNLNVKDAKAKILQEFNIK